MKLPKSDLLPRTLTPTQSAVRATRQSVSDVAKNMHEAADAELAARLNLDIKGDPNDPLKGAIEKAIPHRVKMDIAPDGRRLETHVSNRDREPSK